MIALPEPLTNVSAGAWFEYGCRTISWTVPEPGSWHRCGWVFAWFDVKERTPWEGDGLWFSGQRRHGDITSVRTPFTDKARTAMSAEVLPVIARYGFDRLWTELRQAKAADEQFDKAIADARAAVDWYETKRDLTEWMAAGQLTFVPCRDGRERRIRVCCTYRQYDYESVGAAAWRDGEHVGWMTRGGNLIPLESILDTTRLGV